MTLSVTTIPVTPFAQNCRLLMSPDRSSAVIIDPGGDAELIIDELDKVGASPFAIWLTHSHLDHCGGVAALLRRYQIPLLGNALEQEFRSRVVDICNLYGLPVSDMENCPEPSQYIEGGERISFGEFVFEVLSTPGHSPGHLCFYCKSEGVLLAGDALFAGSIGRTDLPGGDHELLLRSIQENIYTLPNETKVLAGHGPDTTVGSEKRSNPFIRGVA